MRVDQLLEGMPSKYLDGVKKMALLTGWLPTHGTSIGVTTDTSKFSVDKMSVVLKAKWLLEMHKAEATDFLEPNACLRLV